MVAADEETLAPGTVLGGRYRVDAVLGRGGFGTMYAGVEVASGRALAIKRLDLRGLRDWKGVELFEREAAVLRRLDHPRIPAYVDFLPIAADRAGFLIQALAPGRSLATVLAEEGPLSIEHVVAIAGQVLEILTYLGGLRPPVVHRDIKPANLMIDADGVVRLVDFGAVRDAAAQTSTFGSTVAGTFGFMAPELLSGQGEPRSDLFSLGMTMIALLTGKAPAELPQRRLRPDYRGLVAADEAILAVIDRLSEPVPEDRFKDAAAARRALADAAAPPVAGPSGDLAAIVEAERRSEQKAAAVAQRRAEVAQQRRLEARARQPSRIAVHRGESGTRIVIRGPSLRTLYAEEAMELLFVPCVFCVFVCGWGIGAFQAFLPSVLISLGIFVLFGLHALYSHRRYVIDVAPTGHFAIYRSSPRFAEVVGRAGELVIKDDSVADDRLNEISLYRSSGGWVTITLLRASEVEELRAAIPWVTRPASRFRR